MRKLLSRPEQDEFGTSQTSIRHQPRRRRAMREYAVAPIHTSGVAVRHVGPPGCNLSPALDLDVEPRGPLLACLTHPRGCRASQRHACREPPGNREEASGGPGGGNCHPTSGFAAQSRHPVMPQNADTRFCRRSRADLTAAIRDRSHSSRGSGPWRVRSPTSAPVGGRRRHTPPTRTAPGPP